MLDESNRASRLTTTLALTPWLACGSVFSIHVAVTEAEVHFSVEDAAIVEHGSDAQQLSGTRALKVTQAQTTMPELKLSPRQNGGPISSAIGGVGTSRSVEGSIEFSLGESNIVATQQGDNTVMWHLRTVRGISAFGDVPRGNYTFWARADALGRGARITFCVTPQKRCIYNREQSLVTGLKHAAYLVLLGRMGGVPPMGKLTASIALP